MIRYLIYRWSGDEWRRPEIPAWRRFHLPGVTSPGFVFPGNASSRRASWNGRQLPTQPRYS